MIVIKALPVGRLAFGEALEVASFQGVKECFAEEHVSGVDNNIECTYKDGSFWFDNFKISAMEEILINPMSLVGMTTYHTKNVPGNVGVSYGLLYALQEELTYKLALTAPLGTGSTSAEVLIANMVEY